MRLKIFMRVIFQSFSYKRNKWVAYDFWSSEIAVLCLKCPSFKKRAHYVKYKRPDLGPESRNLTSGSQVLYKIFPPFIVTNLIKSLWNSQAQPNWKNFTSNFYRFRKENKNRFGFIVEIAKKESKIYLGTIKSSKNHGKY